MMHKKPTEQVVAATRSAQGLSFSNPNTSGSKTPALTLNGNWIESKPLINTKQDSCAKSSEFRKLPTREFNRLIDQQVAHFVEGCVQQWSSRPAKLKKTLLSLFKLLLRYRCFAQGERIGYSSVKLQKHLNVHRSTLTRTLGTLEELPHLFRVVRVRKGDIAYNGIPAKRAHIEFELGPELCPGLNRAQCSNSAENLVSDTLSPATLWVASCTAEGSTALPDHYGTTTHTNTVQNLRLKQVSSAIPPRLNFQETIQPDSKEGSTPSIHQPSTLRKAASFRKPLAKAASHNPQSNKTPFAPAPSSENTSLFALIRQHRRIAEGKSAYIPIDAEEWTVVANAWKNLPSAMRASQRLALCSEVSQMALEDSKRNGRSSATLRYTFAPRNDGQTPFLERISRLREERMARKKAKHGQVTASLARALFGTETPPPSPRLQRRKPTSPAPKHLLAKASKPVLIPPREMLSQLAAFKRAGYGLAG